MKETFPPVSANGDIIIHTQGDVAIPVQFLGDDDIPIDMSDASVWFEISNGYRAPLAPTVEVHTLLLYLSGADFASMLSSPGQFAVIDETSEPFQILWTGKFIVQGW